MVFNGLVSAAERVGPCPVAENRYGSGVMGSCTLCQGL